MAAGLTIVVWWKKLAHLFWLRISIYHIWFWAKFIWMPKRSDGSLENPKVTPSRFRIFQSVGIIFWGLIYLRYCFSFIVWLLWSCETFFFGFRLWHCLFGNFQTRLMLPEESGKNSLKAKIKGWALLVVSFFWRIYEPWHSKNGFRSLQICKHTF